MRIYVISDTHVPERAQRIPEKFTSLLKKEDFVFHAGDFTSVKTLKSLEDFCKVFAVHGNMDDPELKRILPERRTEVVSGKKIGLFHGLGTPFDLPERVYRKFDEKPDVIVFGHSHDPCHKKIDEVLLFNPGSLAGNVFSQKGSYGILNIEDEVWGEIVYI
jgi:putative phosphoesterase